MCLSAGDVNPLCDECFEKEQDAGKDVELCSSCKELMTRYCWCCMTAYNTKEEAQIEEGACLKCRSG
jgi:hypothetical protein